MPRILFVLPTLAHCGGARQVSLLAAGLPREQFDLRVCALSGEGPVAGTLRALGVPVDALGPTRLFNLSALRRLRRLVADYRPDVIHSFGPSSLRAIVLAGAGTGRLLASHPLPTRAHPGKPGHIDRWFLRRVDHFLARGQAEAATWCRLGLPAGRIRVTPPAAPLQSAIRNPQSAIRNPYLACAGPLEPHKGIRDAIWSFEILQFLYEDLCLVVVGTGPEREPLERFAAATGAASAVHFTGEQMDLRIWLAGAEVVWVPNRADGGLQTALEAMSVGRPVVASRLPALSEIVVEGETGYLVAPGDKVELARRTRELLDDLALRRRLGEAGRRRAEICFAPRDFIQRVADLYLGRKAA